MPPRRREAAPLAAPAWRHFAFFKSSEAATAHTSPLRQPGLISTLVSSTDGVVLAADLEGWIHILGPGPTYQIQQSFQAYGQGSASAARCTEIVFVDDDRWAGHVVLTVGEQDARGTPLARLWFLPPAGAPTMLRQAAVAPSSTPHPVSAVCITPRVEGAPSCVIFGLASGSVVYFRHIYDKIHDGISEFARAQHSQTTEVDSTQSLGKLRILCETAEPVTGLCYLGARAQTTTRNSVDAPHNTLLIVTPASVRSMTLRADLRPASALQMVDSFGSGRSLCTKASLAASEDATASDERMILARDEAIYVYGPEGREPCYALEGPKSQIQMLTRRAISLRSTTSLATTPQQHAREGAGGGVSTYLVVVTPAAPASASAASATIRNYAKQQSGALPTSVGKVTIFDIENKFVAFSSTFEDGVKDIWEDGGRLWVGSDQGGLYEIREQELDKTMAQLFERNLYGLAASVARSRRLQPSQIAEVYRRYGDHLYDKGEFESAMRCYMKTIGEVQASYVIRKFLDTQRLSHLTKYLQELHSCQLANPDHTTLLLNCYTKLGDEQALSEFIRSSASNGRHAESGLDDATSRPFDVETSIRVCRQAGYFDHAVWLAKHYGEHQEYLRIQVEDRQDFAQALMYLCSRPEDEDRMIDNLVRYGQHLMDALPDETTRTLTDFCCGSFRSNPRASSRPHANGSETVTEEENATTDATIHRRRAELASSVRPLPSPRLFFALYINHPGHFIAFLEQLTERRWRKRITAGAVHGDEPPAPTADAQDEPAVWSALLEIYLQLASEAGSVERADLERKALTLLLADVPRDDMQALLTCLTASFVPGITLLYERLGMREDILRLWIDRSLAEPTNGSYSRAVLEVLGKYGDTSPHMYQSVLRYLVSDSELLARHETDLFSLLDTIDEQHILSPVSVIELLGATDTARVGLVREYVKRHLLREQDEINSSQSLIESYRGETAKKRKEIGELSDANAPRVFQVTRCSACGGQLALPSVHFMCRHSYHQRCLAENETQCPNCARTHGMITEMRRANKLLANEHGTFLSEVREADDGFEAIANAFSKGLVGLSKE